MLGENRWLQDRGFFSMMTKMSGIRITKGTGFTLIEILVVVAIIGFLVAAGAFIASSQLSRGRDAKRISNVKVLASAMEQSMSIEGLYPSNSVAGGNPTSCDYVTNALSNYLQGSFTLADSAVDYGCSGDSVSYCICAKLESSNQGNSQSDNCVWGDGNFFCMVNQQ